MMKHFALSLLILATVQVARAEKLDVETHTTLIQKLESALGMNTDDAMVSQPKLVHRLADLYAERARLLAFDKEGQGEKIYKNQIQSDRKKSLSLLGKTLPHVEKSEKGPVLMQMAHLHGMLQQPQEAKKIYLQIEKNSSSYDRRTQALALIQLGDLAFQKGELPQAQRYFERALRISDNPRKAYSQFRLAWIHFSRGQTITAERQLVQILKDPELMKNGKASLDPAFQEEVSHDLATFMAHNDITPASLSLLTSLSPENTRKKNLIYLATELDRTAKKKSALYVWSSLGPHEITFDDQLDRQVQVARIEYDLGHKKSLLKELNTAIFLIKSPSCSNNPKCPVAQQNLRRIITDWGKAEERLPTLDLLQAYFLFTTHFEDDEMAYWAAQSAMTLKKYKMAFEFYATTANLLFKKSQASSKRFEGSLLGAIEAAELSRLLPLRIQAYQMYLKLNPKGNKASEVRYQIAHSFYEKNDFATASQEFRTLALDSTLPQSLREKAGDLCLDSTVILKNDAQLEAYSFELSRGLKSRSSEYMAIWRKSVLNQAAKVINQNSATSAQEHQLAKIQSLNLSTWPLDQRRQMIKNKIVLSFRLKNLTALNAASKELLSVSAKSLEDQNLAAHHLAWIAEIQMDFKGTLYWMKRIKPTAKEKENHLFKMALLKELDGQNPRNEYTQFIAISKNRSKKQYASHQLVIHSYRPAQDFKKYEKVLLGHSVFYRSAGLFVFEKTKDKKLARQLLSRSSVRNSVEGQLISHSLELDDHLETLNKVSRTPLKPMSDAKLKLALNKRIQIIKGMEKKANRAIARKDSSLQLIYLTSVGHLNEQLAEQILSLPFPKNLKSSQYKAYQEQVQAMVQPYSLQAKTIQEKVRQLWKQSSSQKSFQALHDLSEQKSRPGSLLASQEIRSLKQSAQKVNLNFDPFIDYSSERHKVAAQLQDLKQRIQENPFDSSSLVKMKTLQSSYNDGPMLAYLDGRLNELKMGGSN